MSDINIIIEDSNNDINVNAVSENQFTNINIDSEESLVLSVNGKIGFVVLNKNDIGLSNVENLSITGVSGFLQNQIDQLDSGYASQAEINLVSGNLIITGANLTNLINSLSGYSESVFYRKDNPSGFITGVDLTPYATNANLALTGSTLSTNLAATGLSLQTQINNLDDIYATDASVSGVANNLEITGANIQNNVDTVASNLILTGATLNTKINNLSGYANDNFATINNLNITGATVQTNINTVATNLSATGSILNTKINNLSGYSNNTFSTISNLELTGQNLQAQLNNLDNIYATDASVTTVANNLATTGLTLQTNINTVSSNLAITGSENLARITSLSGNLTGNYATILNLNLTGVNLDNKINFLSGYSNTTFATINNLANTGATLQGNINTVASNLTITGANLNALIVALSGYSISNFATILNLSATGWTLANSLNNTGLSLDTKINNLSGVSVLTYGDQNILGTKYFNNSVYIHDLYVTGTEFIATVQNNFIESPFLLLNLTGGAIDGGIFFVTGSGLTGVNDYGPIIGFDHSNKFKFGVARRSDDLSILNDIASVQQINSYSGFVDGKYSTIDNLQSTGLILNTKIDVLSGYSNNTFATVVNLASTGSTLQTNINTVSTNLATTGSTLSTNLAATGAANLARINSLSGTLTGNYVTITNLASTGSTLNARINNLSGYINSPASNIVFTTGDQAIYGTKEFLIDDGKYFYIDDINQNASTSWIFLDNNANYIGYNQNYATFDQNGVSLASNNNAFLSLTGGEFLLKNLGEEYILRSQAGRLSISSSDLILSAGSINYGNYVLSINSGELFDSYNTILAGNELFFKYNTPVLPLTPDPAFNWDPLSNSKANLRYAYEQEYSGFNNTWVATLYSEASRFKVHRLEIDNLITGSGDYFNDKLIIKSGNLVLQNGNVNITGELTLSGGYNVKNEIESVKKLAIAYAIAL